MAAAEAGEDLQAIQKRVSAQRRKFLSEFKVDMEVKQYGTKPAAIFIKTSENGIKSFAALNHNTRPVCSSHF